MVIGPGFIPIVQAWKSAKSVHPPLHRPCHPQWMQEGGAVGDGCYRRALNKETIYYCLGVLQATERV